MASDFEIQDRGGSDEDRARSAIDQVLGEAARLGYRDEDSFDVLMVLGDELFGRLDDIFGLVEGGAR